MNLPQRRMPATRLPNPLGSKGRWQAWRSRQQGRWGYVLAWLLGVPVPILILIYLLRGCT
jgi:hypothetical protein